MRLWVAALAVLGVLGMSSLPAADDIESRFEKKVFTGKEGGTLGYRFLAPVAPKAGEKYPLVIFLHGAGERGDDNTVQLVHGVKRFAQDDYLKQYPCYVIAPQCPKELIWASTHWSAVEAAYKEEPSATMKLLLELMESDPRHCEVGLGVQEMRMLARALQKLANALSAEQMVEEVTHS